jgi:hypothetical protein
MTFAGGVDVLDGTSRQVGLKVAAAMRRSNLTARIRSSRRSFLADGPRPALDPRRAWSAEHGFSFEGSASAGSIRR